MTSGPSAQDNNPKYRTLNNFSVDFQTDKRGQNQLRLPQLLLGESI